MRSIEGRLKAIERKMPKRELGDFELWLEHEDGTVTGDGGRIVSQEEQDAAAASGDLIILGGDNRFTDRPETISHLQTTASIAKDMGVTARTVQQEKQIATNILPEVQDAIKAAAKAQEGPENA